MIIPDPKLLKLFRQPGPCELCHRMCGRREPHHVRARGMAAGRRLDIRINLVALGPAFRCPCHTRYHTTGELQPEDFLTVIAARERQTVANIQAVTAMLLALDSRLWQMEWPGAVAELTPAQRELAEKTLAEAPIARGKNNEKKG